MAKVVIGYYASGGIGTYIREITEILVKHGRKVDILSSEKVDDSFKQYVQSHSGKVFSIPNLKHPISQYHMMIAILKSGNYDSAYFNISESFNGIGILAARDAGISQIIVHSHASGCDRENTIIRHIRILLNRLGKFIFIPDATTYLSCSDKAAEWLFPAKIVKSGRVIFVPNSVDTKKFSFLPEVRASVRGELSLENKFVIGYVGSFQYVKNVFYFVKVANLLRNTNIIFLMIGDGEDKERLQKLIAANGLQKKFLFTGFRKDVNRLMNAMDLFMLPSLYEGLPFVAVEAQQNGLPVLLSDTITHMVDVNHGCTFLPLSKSADEWKDAILQHQHDVRREGSKFAVAEKFGPDIMAKIILEIIK